MISKFKEPNQVNHLIKNIYRTDDDVTTFTGRWQSTMTTAVILPTLGEFRYSLEDSFEVLIAPNYVKTKQDHLLAAGATVDTKVASQDLKAADNQEIN